VSQGHPVEIGLSEMVAEISADGNACVIFVAPLHLRTDHIVIVWPLSSGLGQPPPCTQGPPTHIQTVLPVDRPGGLSLVPVDLDWYGGDVSVDFDVTSLLPSPTPSPTLTPAALPQAGGAPSDGELRKFWLALPLMFAATAAAFALARKAR
jgi:hypothetical protein